MEKKEFLIHLGLLGSLVALGMACACTTPVDDGHDPDLPPDPAGETVINGTAIAAGNNLVGLVSDARTGNGIAGVPVTDGYSFTVTDANGVYQFKSNRYARNVYYTLPAAYKPTLDPTTRLPLFYSTAPVYESMQNRNDFVLEPLDAPEEEFTLVMVGDPQCKTDSDVGRFRTETIPDMKAFLAAGQAEGRYPSPYLFTLGDITFDNTVQWKPMQTAMSRFAVTEGAYLPVYNCIGNHDHDASQSTDYDATQLYVDHFGPTDYSLDRGKVHIVVMDNVVGTTTNGSTWSYAGGFSNAQLKWLEADLALVEDKQDKMIVFCAHIPFRSGASSGGASVNKDKKYAEVLQLLTGFREAHLMIGHTHYPQNYIHTAYRTQGGTPVYEHVHGAACGAWWSCNLNVNGAPNGYSVYEVSGNGMKNWVAKGTKEPAGCQLRVYDGNQQYGGAGGYPEGRYAYTWYGGGTGGTAQISAAGNAALKGCFVAAVWNDDDTHWKLELFQGGVKVGDLRRVPSRIPDLCAVSYFFNVLGKNTTTWTTTTAQHYWYIEAPGGVPSEVVDWEIRATQTIPGSGEVNVYTASTLQTDYSGF